MVTATLTIYNKVYPKYIHRHPHKTQSTHKNNPPPHKNYTEKVCNRKEIPFVDRRRYGTFSTSMTQARQCIGHKDTLGRSLVEALGTGGPLVGRRQQPNQENPSSPPKDGNLEGWAHEKKENRDERISNQEIPQHQS